MAGWKSISPPLSQHCLHALERLCFKAPTPVQVATLPHFMKNKDVAVEAVTGSGKTLAFVIPIVETMMKKVKPWGARETGAVVITPTRELATQVAGVFSSFLPPSLSLALLIGGSDVAADVTMINETGANVVVTTPGRFLALLSQTDCQLASNVRSLEFLVLDEADRLLEMGFEQSVSSIIRYLPKQRRTGLFSATLSVGVKQLVRAGLRHPVTIAIREEGQAEGHVATPPALHSYFLECQPKEKLNTLLALLQQLKNQKVLVFFATCASVTFFSSLTERLLSEIPVLALHGRMHNKRQALFNQFSAMESGVLMATDVLARGVDFPAVDWVLQFDPPSSSNFFVHRCGRTARMGLEGRAVVLLTTVELCYVDYLRLSRGISLQPYSLPPPPSLSSRARQLVASERELYEQGVRAFVSFVRFYHKHECKLIFQAKALDLVAIAESFALLRLPKMPELKSVDTSTFDPYPVDISTIPYKNKAMEKERQRKRKEEEEGEEKGKAEDGRKEDVSMNCDLEKRTRQTRREEEKKEARREQRKKAARRERRGVRRVKKRRRQQQSLTEEEVAELGRDARLLKKYKAGKISEAELDQQLGCPPSPPTS